jgi:hypothetical protein
MRKKRNKAVERDVYEAVSYAVKRAVDRDVYTAVGWAVGRAVNRAVYWAMDRDAVPTHWNAWEGEG